MKEPQELEISIDFISYWSQPRLTPLLYSKSSTDSLYIVF